MTDAQESIPEKTESPLQAHYGISLRYASQRIRLMYDQTPWNTIRTQLTPEIDEKVLLELEPTDQYRHSVLFITTVCLLTLLLWVVPILLSLTVPTCVSDLCIPQFTFQLKDQNPHAREILLSGKELMKVVSYFAKDFGPTETDVTAYLDIVDTFSTTHIYSLNFWGYCRASTVTGETFCARSYGLDLLSILMRDFGNQLGQLLQHDAKSVGDSFVDSYEEAMQNLQLFLSSQKRSVDAVHSTILLKKFSQCVAWCVLGVTVLSFLVAAYSLFVCVSFVYGSLLPKLRLYPSFVLILSGEISVFLLTFFIGASEYEFFNQICKLTGLIDIADVHRSAGNTVLWVSPNIRSPPIPHSATTHSHYIMGSCFSKPKSPPLNEKPSSRTAQTPNVRPPGAKKGRVLGNTPNATEDARESARQAALERHTATSAKEQGPLGRRLDQERKKTAQQVLKDDVALKEQLKRAEKKQKINEEW
ncbi:hypothetical protein BABINDRAFT_10317 [Babjeviella inositovora NRRL Y-12698]|uniref:Uncharacterized protein n=1 Tax=Babjeviella inositovora NRRL Y-12698 TaxID=984486 RepID=A0A1E3QHH4_9ASCO|nr:uncharacterized protein BABINDRAFT_10317 [Babjeviella inositovora NRRL Y-12698]ODQ77163.1 hypothetical protein BABINDRAFT_10317 [Babjeviella inositovora NRRL Y-12698]